MSTIRLLISASVLATLSAAAPAIQPDAVKPAPATPPATSSALEADAGRIAAALERMSDSDQQASAREARDLDAQIAQAKAANDMVWIGWISLLLSVLGVGLIWRTLKATQAAVREAELATEAAREATAATWAVAEGQARAYIQFANVEVTMRRTPEDLTRWSAIISVRAVNAGQTQAFAVTSEVEVKIRSLVNAQAGRVRPNLATRVVDIESGGHANLNWESDPGIIEGTFLASDNPVLVMTAHFILNYLDVFEKERSLAVCYEGGLTVRDTRGGVVSEFSGGLLRLPEAEIFKPQHLAWPDNNSSASAASTAS